MYTWDTKTIFSKTVYVQSTNLPQKTKYFTWIISVHPWQIPCSRHKIVDTRSSVLSNSRHKIRAPENLKLAGNWPKIAAMYGLQDKKKTHICVVFKLIIPITLVFMHLFWDFRPIWLAISISGSSFWLLNTYFWCYFSWLAKSGCQNLKLAGNTFQPFPSFWSPAQDRQYYWKVDTIVFFFFIYSLGEGRLGIVRINLLYLT